MTELMLENLIEWERHRMEHGYPFIPWNAKLSTGDIIQEKPIKHDFSCWRLLMNHCRKTGQYITHLWFNVNGKVLPCRDNMAGYWQAGGIYLTKRLSGAEERIYSKGIGWVEKDHVFIIWIGDLGVWRETRSVKNQNNIIWAPGKEVDKDERGNLIYRP